MTAHAAKAECREHGRCWRLEVSHPLRLSAGVLRREDGHGSTGRDGRGERVAKPQESKYRWKEQSHFGNKRWEEKLDLAVIVSDTPRTWLHCLLWLRFPVS